MRRKVKDKYDLANIHAYETGFILNDRTEGRKLHKAKCSCVDEGMVTSEYDKWFYETEDLEGLEKMLDAEYSKDGWQPCGYCLQPLKQKRKPRISPDELQRMFGTNA